MKRSLCKACIVASLLFGTTALAAPASLAAEPDRAVINVTGYAQQEVAPDTAYVTVGMESIDTDAQKARTKNNLVMNQVTNAMKAMGIPAENLKTTGFYVAPNYDAKGGKITSYTATNNLQIKITDLDMMSRVISKAGSLGANRIQNVRFTNEKTEQIKATLVKQAVINGRRTAEAAAQAAGSQITGVKEINISSSSPSYNNAYLMGSARMLKAEAADNTPVESGTNTLSQTVSITFYIQ